MPRTDAVGRPPAWSAGGLLAVPPYSTDFQVAYYRKEDGFFEADVQRLEAMEKVFAQAGKADVGQLPVFQRELLHVFRQEVAKFKAHHKEQTGTSILRDEAIEEQNKKGRKHKTFLYLCDETREHDGPPTVGSGKYDVGASRTVVYDTSVPLSETVDRIMEYPTEQQAKAVEVHAGYVHNALQLLVISRQLLALKEEEEKLTKALESSKATSRRYWQALDYLTDQMTADTSDRHRGGNGLDAEVDAVKSEFFRRCGVSPRQLSLMARADTLVPEEGQTLVPEDEDEDDCFAVGDEVVYKSTKGSKRKLNAIVSQQNADGTYALQLPCGQALHKMARKENIEKRTTA
jgi:hypothetical protein